LLYNWVTEGTNKTKIIIFHDAIRKISLVHSLQLQRY